MQDKDKTTHKPTSKVSRSDFALWHSPPTPTRPNLQDTNPPKTHGPTSSGLATMGQLGISRLAVLSLPRRPLHPPAPARRCPPPWVQAQEVATAIPLRPAPTPTSTGAATPPLPAGPRGGDAPAPSPPPVATFYPFQNFLSSESLSLQGIGSSRSGGIFRTRYPPILRWSQDFLSTS